MDAPRDDADGLAHDALVELNELRIAMRMTPVAHPDTQEPPVTTTRPLRQHHGAPAPLEVDDTLGPVVAPWRAHRERLVRELEALTDEQWRAPSRCDGWSVQDVVSHLVSADQFWVVSLLAATDGSPTEILRDFDPAGTPEDLVAPTRADPPAEVLDRFRAGTAVFVATVDGLDEAAWAAVGESPIGHVPVPLVLAHAHWDSWLHERDVLVPLGSAPPVEPEELAVATWYALGIGAVQGGLLDDPEPVGPGLDDPIDVTLAFDDLPDLALRLRIGRRVELSRGDPDRAVEAGSALALVERFTGRRDDPVHPTLPDDLVAHLERAFQIL